VLATHKSAIKRQKQSLLSRDRNQSVKSRIRTLAKKVVTAVEEKNAAAAKAALVAAIPVIGKAAAKGVIKKATASRKISRLSKKVHGLSAASAS